MNSLGSVAAAAFLLLSFSSSCSCREIQTTPPLQLEVYATSNQVAQYCADEAGCRRVVQVLKEWGGAKIYLEVYRGGHRVSAEILATARDQLTEAGLQVAAGITTTPGEGFGVASDHNPSFFNFEAPETRNLLMDLFESTAALFDEILIDDFFLTDDASALSLEKKGSQSWPEYRLRLMTEIAESCVAAPARRKNPNVSIALKYPQWYDRFREFGYSVESGPRIFDQIWVGTETRDPVTQRFGYVQPTMGYNNYRWLSSVGGDKVQGAWFDPLDCHEDVYLMQAYQSVLAGARSLTLFNLEEFLGPNPVLDKFKRRKETLGQLAEILADRKPLGIAGYKPPRAAPGRDMYLFDFLSVLGLPIVPVGRVEGCDSFPSVLLAGDLEGEVNLPGLIAKWTVGQSKTLLFTPSLLESGREFEEFNSKTLFVNGAKIDVATNLSFLRVSATPFDEVLVRAKDGERTVPVLTRSVRQSGGKDLFLNVFTYSSSDFDRVAEMFLPPTRSGIPHWPEDFANAIRKELPLGLPIKVEAKPPFGLNLYEGGVVVIANFEGETKEVTIETDTDSSTVSLHPGFAHAEGIVLLKEANQRRRLTLPGWEIAVLNLSS